MIIKIGQKKSILNFKDYYDKKKIKHLIVNEKFPNKNDVWQNQAIQRDYIIKNLLEFDSNDYIFFQIQMKFLILKFLKILN